MPINSYQEGRKDHHTPVSRYFANVEQERTGGLGIAALMQNSLAVELVPGGPKKLKKLRHSKKNQSAKDERRQNRFSGYGKCSDAAGGSTART